jgi:phosphoribosylanthranilate isomerase
LFYRVCATARAKFDTKSDISDPPPIATFLLTSKQSVEQIIAQQRRLRTNTIQICDHLIDGEYDDLREALPGISLVQLIHVGGEESVMEAVEVASKAVASTGAC